MPVGRPEEMQDGRPMRQFRGGEAPLGKLTEWRCPSCDHKNTGPFEAGCASCGVGVPPEQRPADWQLTDRQRTPIVINPQEILQGLPEITDQEKREIQQEYEGRRGRASIAVVPALVEVIRVIRYRCRPEQQAALQQTLQRSLVGTFDFMWGSLTAAVVDDLSPRQADILGILERQPGVWLGGPREEHGVGMERQPPDVGRTSTRASNLSSRPAQAPPTPPIMPPAAPVVPDTGPAFSRLDQEIAREIHRAGGPILCYTLAVALQQFAVLGPEVQEPGHTLTEGECLRLANALIQQVPEEWMQGIAPPGETDQERIAREGLEKENAARERMEKEQAGG